jgi:hypothetical protein
MDSKTAVLQAQSRALIKVLKFYELDRVGSPQLVSFWRHIEAFGMGELDAMDLPGIHLAFHDVALEAYLQHSFYSTPTSALIRALFEFCGNNPAFRFFEPARSVAHAIRLLRKDPTSTDALVGEVLDRMEDTFDAEMASGVAA